MTRYRQFDRNQLKVQSLRCRKNLVSVTDLLDPAACRVSVAEESLRAVSAAVVEARQAGRPVILLFGAHLIKEGLSRVLIELLREGLVTHLATNGAGLVHDFELAYQGATSESVPENIQDGTFGLWDETGRFLNEVALEAWKRGEGLGEAAGRRILEAELPYRSLSVFAAAWQLGVPMTCHVSIGQDIVHEHPECDGAAWGASSYTDFLIFAAALEELEGGVYLNVGSAVTGPEIYLKALSMARNVARSRGATIGRFTTAVFDLQPLPEGWRQGPPSKDHPAYYYRPWKTILVRTVSDGGTSYYVCGNHRQTLASFYALVKQLGAAPPDAAEVRSAA